MQTKPTIVHDVDGNPAHAEVAECEQCGGERFLIYFVFVAGKPHQHVQCVKCGVSYCDNTCKEGVDPDGQAQRP